MNKSTKNNASKNFQNVQLTKQEMKALKGGEDGVIIEEMADL